LPKTLKLFSGKNGRNKSLKNMYFFVEINNIKVIRAKLFENYFIDKKKPPNQQQKKVRTII